MEYVSKTTHDGRNVRVKDYKKRIKRNRRRRKILFFSFLLLCIFIFILYAPFFNIKEIRCVGNDIMTDEELIAVSTIGYDYNVFRTSIKKAERLVETIPYVKKASVKRKFPNIIEINITKSEVFGYIPLNEGYIYIDENSKMLEYSQVPPEKNVPVIQNTGVLSFEGGKQIVADEDKKTELIKKGISALITNDILHKITIINVSETDEFTIFYDNNLEILVGDVKDIDYKINFALRIINDTLGDEPKGFLDVSNPERESIHREKK